MARSRRLVVAGAIALATPCALSLFACEAITGLSDFEKTQCTGLRCPDDGGFDADARVDADANIELVDAPGAKPVKWARWRMPNYVAALPPGIEAGVDNTDGGYDPVGDGYRDSVTRLVWAMPMPDVGPKTYADALAACADLKPSGSWRLPSRIELISLLDLSQVGAKVNGVFTGAGGILATPYWTSSEVRPFGKDGLRQYWGVDFGRGDLRKLDMNAPAAVRCVKGGP